MSAPEPPRDPDEPTPAGTAGEPSYYDPAGYGAAPGYPTDEEYAGFGAPRPADALVPDPAIGFASWWDRGVGVVRRSWRPLLVIFAVTVLAPSSLITVVAELASEASDGAGAGMAFGLGTFLLLVALLVAFMYTAAVGWAAAIWTVTREAVGEPAPLAAAFRYGFRRGLPLWGWFLLATVSVGVGVLCCILPGIYLAVALSLIAPVTVFEREAAFPRSFKLIHSNFWPAIGRVLLVGVGFGLYQFVLSCPFGFIEAAARDAPALVRVPVVIVAEVVNNALLLPGLVAVLAAILVTYAELRHRETPVSAPALAVAMEAP